MPDAYAKALARLKRDGFLLERAVARLVAGGEVRGSWWGHPKGRAIWQTLERLKERSDVVVTKWMDGKSTLVHRSKWRALLGSAKAASRGGLSPASRRLLREVERKGVVRASGPAVRELEQRVLVVATEVHTESGAHAKVVESWARWARRMKL